MAASVRVGLGEASDDAELRRLLRENPMPGEIAVAFHREPSFFRATAIEGHSQQVIVGRDAREPARIHGVATRSTRPMFVNGAAQRLGYLSGLRVDGTIRQSLWLKRGFDLLRELHEADPVPLYVSTIIEDNTAARAVLTSGRAGLPTYRDLGRMRTFSMRLVRRRRIPRVEGVAIDRGSDGDWVEIVACLDRHAATRQFAPRFGVEDFAPGSTRVPDLVASDFLVARRGRRVVGTVARWDQRAFKQTVVVGYSGKMRWIRPVYDLAARLGGWAPLPGPGKPFRYCYAAFLAVEEDDPEVFRALLATFSNEALASGYAFFMLGLHERDPLFAIASEHRAVPYDARVYAVFYADGAAFAEALDGRPPKLEVATL